MKMCKRCGKLLSESNFHKHSGTRDRLDQRCKKCKLDELHASGECKPYNQNKNCTLYLGINIAEKVIARLFKNYEHVSSINHPGYDFICNLNKKIDVKSGCLTNVNKLKSQGWQFRINRNVIADYFLCVGFDDREKLNPVHIWFIPGEGVNNRYVLTISNSDKVLSKWARYEKDVESLQECCETMKNIRIAEEQSEMDKIAEGGKA
jgi:hypothetical protein